MRRAPDYPELLGALGEALQPTDSTLLQNNQAEKRAFLDESGLRQEDRGFRGWKRRRANSGGAQPPDEEARA